MKSLIFTLLFFTSFAYAKPIFFGDVEHHNNIKVPKSKAHLDIRVDLARDHDLINELKLTWKCKGELPLTHTAKVCNINYKNITFKTKGKKTSVTVTAYTAIDYNLRDKMAAKQAKLPRSKWKDIREQCTKSASKMTFKFPACN